MRALRRCAWLSLALGACGTQPSGPAAGVVVELAGGPNPGRYQNAKAFPTCSRGLVGQGSWAVQYSDWTGPKSGLRSLQLVLPAAEHPDDFYLGMVFGDFFAGTVYEIETRATAPAAHGRGNVIVRPMGHGTVVKVTGETQGAVAISATITCQTPDSTEGTVS
ncbi:MAG: hypothetical protein ABI742_00770 [Gemmatimonadota bacterium]